MRSNYNGVMASSGDAVLLFLPAYSGVLQWAADNVFGIVGANHLIYALLFTFMLLDLFYLTEKLCRMNNQVERLIVSLAILEADARANAEKHTAASGAAPENLTGV